MSRVTLITGGSRGIGRALAEACVARGDRVMTCARTFEHESPGVVQVIADVRIEADASRVVAAALARFGTIDVLVNNAALAGGEWTDVLATNVLGAEHFARAVLAVNARARIVNVSSGVVAWPRAGASAYIASKHALEGLTRALQCDAPEATVVSVQLGAHRAGVNAAHPDAAPVDDAVAALLAAIGATDVRGRTIEAWRTHRPLALADADLLAHPLGAPAAAREALASCAVHRYPVVDELTKLLAAEHGVPLDAIALGAGASELLARILAVLMRPGERLVANAPSWPLFPHLCHARGVVATTVPYRLRAGRVDHDLEAIAACVDRDVRLVYLISPANPMGCALDAEPFARFLAALPDVAIVVDEAYGEFVTRADAARAIELTRRDPRVIAVRTFSKFYGLAGARVGYVVAAPAVARRLAAAALPFTVSAPAAAAAIAARGDREHARATLALVAAGRAARPEALPSDAPFALVPGAGTFFDGGYGIVPLWTTTPSA